jgi:tetratricopeptide (TPR) repeat protein
MKLCTLLLIVSVTLFIFNKGKAQSLTLADSILLNTAQSDTTLLREIIHNKPDEKVTAIALNRIGIIYYKSKRDDKAEQVFLSVYNQFQGRAEAFLAAFYLGEIAFHKENLKKAKAYLSEFLSSNPEGTLAKWAQYYYVKSKFRDNDSDYVDAAHNFLADQHNFMRSKKATVQYEIIRYLMNNHNYAQALIEAQTLINNNPRDTLTEKVKFMIGEIYILLKRPIEALTHYNLIINENGITPMEAAKARFYIGEVFDNIGDIENARINYQLLLNTYPNQKRWATAAKYSLAMLNYQGWLTKNDSINQYKGYSSLLNYINQNPGDHHVPHALRALADMYISDGRYNEAIDCFNKILSFDTSLVTLDPHASIRSNDLIEHKKIITDVKFTMARIMREMLHKPQDALSIYYGMLSVSPNNSILKLNKALCLIDLNRSDEAKVILNQLVQEGGNQKKHAQYILLTLK